MEIDFFFLFLLFLFTLHFIFLPFISISLCIPKSYGALTHSNVIISTIRCVLSVRKTNIFITMLVLYDETKKKVSEFHFLSFLFFFLLRFFIFIIFILFRFIFPFVIIWMCDNVDVCFIIVKYTLSLFRWLSCEIKWWQGISLQVY